MASETDVAAELTAAMERLAEFSVAMNLLAIGTGVTRLVVCGADGAGVPYVLDLTGLLSDVSALMLAQLALQNGVANG